MGKVTSAHNSILDATDGAGIDLSLGQFFTYLAGKKWHHEVLNWPPDVFCLVAAVLHKSGGYIRYIYEWPPGGNTFESKANQLKVWTAKIRRIGGEWWYSSSRRFENLPQPESHPKEVVGWWKEITRQERITLRQLQNDVERGKPQFAVLWEALLQLASCADEACSGMGQYDSSEFAKMAEYVAAPPKNDILWVAQTRLLAQQIPSLSASSKTHAASTLTQNIKPALAGVLPKFHTPKTGITLRSISHNLAFVRPSEVIPIFAQDFTGAGRAQDGSTRNRSLNLVLVPWPLVVSDSDFQITPNPTQLADEFGFFSYQPPHEDLTKEELDSVRRLLKDAIQKLNAVDLLVFPESALSDKSAQEIIIILGELCPDCVLVAGIRSRENPYALNMARISQYLGVDIPSHSVDQHKHHRWQLDDWQIQQYSLEKVFKHKKRGWWEQINIKARTLHFSTLADNISLSVLVCEDLARQDPSAEFIRCVGPNLVIALLMDGPQLSNRWSARYASVFADDPGSSVLTLTSLGMSNRSKSKSDEQSKSRVVALWKDHFEGAKAIEISQGMSAVALSLNVEAHHEWTADGRDDFGSAVYLRYKGIQQLAG